MSTGSKREANVKFGYGHGTRKKLIARGAGYSEDLLAQPSAIGKAVYPPQPEPDTARGQTRERADGLFFAFGKK